MAVAAALLLSLPSAADVTGAAAVHGVGLDRTVATDAAARAGSSVAYTAPLPTTRVVRGFDPPADAYGPGHRGVDLAAADGAVVTAAADGTVSFAGPVAGRGVVVLRHADGIRTEYEPVARSVSTGAVVHAGQPIGRLAGTHQGCPGACLHWGARRADVYLDPLSLLGGLGPVRLLPWRARPG